MKIKMFIPMALVLCLAFSLCACGTTANINETTTAPATTVTTNAATEATTTAATVAATDADAATFTSDDAIAAVETANEIADNCYLKFRGTEEIDGVTYYAVDLMKSLESNSTYMSTYFVTADGEITTGYYEDGVAYLSDGEPTLDITEENAVKAVDAAYDLEDGTYLKLRGTEEVDGVTYYAVDLMRSLQTNSTYLSTFFISTSGNIVEGYYEDGVAVFAE